MKIVTWNVYKNNRKIDEACAFIRQHDFDIICLQEFPQHAIHKIAALNREYVVEEETLLFKNKRKKAAKMHTVIISRVPIKNSGVIPHKNYYENVAGIDDRYIDFKADSVFIDVEVENRKLRIFNVHFKCVAGPYHRLSQLKEVMDNFCPESENIVCGDMNSFGHPLVNIFIWEYFGYKVGEFFINERSILATTFDRNKLENPFRGSATFLKFPIQLDYILLPKDTPILSKKRFLRSYGSDHLPLSIEI